MDKEENQKHDSKKDGKEKLASAIVNASDRIEEAYARIARIEKQLNLGATAPSSASPQAIPESLKQYDEIVNLYLAQFIDRAREIGDKVEQMVRSLFLSP